MGTNFFQMLDPACKMYYVQNRRQRYICHSVIESTAKKKNWRRNVFMCMKDYGTKKSIGKIQIIHLIGRRVNFSKRAECLCVKKCTWF